MSASLAAYMKIRVLLLSVLAGILGTAASQAATPCHAVSVSGAFTIQTDDPTIAKTISFNNASIFKGAIALTDTSTKASELDLVITDDAQTFEVIRKADSSLYYSLAATGTGSLPYGQVVQTTKKASTTTLARSDVELKLPYTVKGVSGGFLADTFVVLVSHTTENNQSDITKITGSFVGGAYMNVTPQAFIQGSYKTGKKTYQVTFQ